MSVGQVLGCSWVLQNNGNIYYASYENIKTLKMTKYQTRGTII